MARRKNYDSPFDRDNFESFNNSTINEFDALDYFDRDDPYYSMENSYSNKHTSHLPTRYLMTMTTLDADNKKKNGYEQFKEDEGLK